MVVDSRAREDRDAVGIVAAIERLSQREARRLAQGANQP
jgi:hypothetical protein